MKEFNSAKIFFFCYLFRNLRHAIFIDTANVRCYATDQMLCRFFCHFGYGVTQKTQNWNEILTVKGTSKPSSTEHRI